MRCETRVNVVLCKSAQLQETWQPQDYESEGRAFESLRVHHFPFFADVSCGAKPRCDGFGRRWWRTGRSGVPVDVRRLESMIVAARPAP